MSVCLWCGKEREVDYNSGACVECRSAAEMAVKDYQATAAAYLIGMMLVAIMLIVLVIKF